jgi:mono/diheme cytochrome c family protein
VLVGLTVLALLLSACGRNMAEQPKYLPYQESILFEDRSSARPLIEGTVSRERGGLSLAFLRGTDERGAFLREAPIEVTLEVLQRGQERYNIYCAPCHNYDGGGNGIVVQKGFPAPASFHEPRLQQADIGYIYFAITNGFGRMYSYASRIPPEDRWAISAYVRALQLSQSATLDDIPEPLRETLREAPRQLVAAGEGAQ